jgi:hypothetical protein
MAPLLTPQAITLAVLVMVVAALIWDKLRSDRDRDLLPLLRTPSLVHPADIYGCSPLRCVKLRTVRASRAFILDLGIAIHRRQE